MAKSFSELQTLAIQIRDELNKKKNSAQRVGSALLDIIDNCIQNITDIKQKLSVFEHACSGFKRVSSEAQLPVTPSQEDLAKGFLVNTSLYLYVGTGGNAVNGRYFNVGDIRGPQGEPGSKGETGNTGPTGEKGEQGNSGVTGDTSDIVVINNLDGGESEEGSIKVLAAEQGKVLNKKFTELDKANISTQDTVFGRRYTQLSGVEDNASHGLIIGNNGEILAYGAAGGYNITTIITVKKGMSVSYKLRTPNKNTYQVVIGFWNTIGVFDYEKSIKSDGYDAIGTYTFTEDGYIRVVVDQSKDCYFSFYGNNYNKEYILTSFPVNLSEFKEYILLDNITLYKDINVPSNCIIDFNGYEINFNGYSLHSLAARECNEYPEIKNIKGKINLDGGVFYIKKLFSSNLSNLNNVSHLSKTRIILDSDIAYTESAENVLIMPDEYDAKNCYAYFYDNISVEGNGVFKIKNATTSITGGVTFTRCVFENCRIFHYSIDKKVLANYLFCEFNDTELIDKYNCGRIPLGVTFKLVSCKNNYSGKETSYTFLYSEHSIDSVVDNCSFNCSVEEGKKYYRPVWLASSYNATITKNNTFGTLTGFIMMPPTWDNNLDFNYNAKKVHEGDKELKYENLYLFRRNTISENFCDDNKEEAVSFDGFGDSKLSLAKLKVVNFEKITEIGQSDVQILNEQSYKATVRLETSEAYFEYRKGCIISRITKDKDIITTTIKSIQKNSEDTDNTLFDIVVNDNTFFYYKQVLKEEGGDREILVNDTEVDDIFSVYGGFVDNIIKNNTFNKCMTSICLFGYAYRNKVISNYCSGETFTGTGGNIYVSCFRGIRKIGLAPSSENILENNQCGRMFIKPNVFTNYQEDDINDYSGRFNVLSSNRIVSKIENWVEIIGQQDVFAKDMTIDILHIKNSTVKYLSNIYTSSLDKTGSIIPDYFNIVQVE